MKRRDPESRKTIAGSMVVLGSSHPLGFFSQYVGIEPFHDTKDNTQALHEAIDGDAEHAIRFRFVFGQQHRLSFLIRKPPAISLSARGGGGGGAIGRGGRGGAGLDEREGTANKRREFGVDL